MRARTLRYGAALATRADQEEMSRNGLWSALQTHLQGVDGTTLAIKPEIILHCVILLSRKVAGLQYHCRQNEAREPQVLGISGGAGGVGDRRQREPHPEAARRGLEGGGGCTDADGCKEQRWSVSFEAPPYGLRASEPV
ncbi:hypothetical protein RCCGE510_02678, partial [Rhizobium sp. CCGE 510]